MNVLLVGYNGKMGQNVRVLANKLNINIIAGIDNQNVDNKIVFSTFNAINDSLIPQIDAIIDFSNPSIIDEELLFCKHNNIPLAIFATGHNEVQLKHIKKTSQYIPIFLTSNTSLGIALINEILTNYKSHLKKYDCNIIEKHHKHKVDAPSGTAKQFQNILETDQCLSIRSGEYVGEHEVTFSKDYEEISISHKAYDRKLFALGALEICEYIVNKNPSLYTMHDFVYSDNKKLNPS